MKEFITTKYTFSPGASGVGFVDLSGIDSFDSTRLVAIINQTRGVLLYSTASETSKYTLIEGNRVFLNTDTSSHSAEDSLQIIYNKESSTVDMVVLLNNLLSIIATPAIRDKTINADRVTLVGGSTTISSGTVTTVSNLSTFSNYQSQIQTINSNLNAWANTCRSTIT